MDKMKEQYYFNVKLKIFDFDEITPEIEEAVYNAFELEDDAFAGATINWFDKKVSIDTISVGLPLKEAEVQLRDKLVKMMFSVKTKEIK